jgi:hypothetical protein
MPAEAGIVTIALALLARAAVEDAGLRSTAHRPALTDS